MGNRLLQCLSKDLLHSESFTSPDKSQSTDCLRDFNPFSVDASHSQWPVFGISQAILHTQAAPLVTKEARPAESKNGLKVYLCLVSFVWIRLLIFLQGWGEGRSIVSVLLASDPAKERGQLPRQKSTPKNHRDFQELECRIRYPFHHPPTNNSSQLPRYMERSKCCDCAQLTCKTWRKR